MKSCSILNSSMKVSMRFFNMECPILKWSSCSLLQNTAFGTNYKTHKLYIVEMHSSAVLCISIIKLILYCRCIMCFLIYIIYKHLNLQLHSIPIPSSHYIIILLLLFKNCELIKLMKGSHIYIVKAGRLYYIPVLLSLYMPNMNKTKKVIYRRK